MDTAARDQFLLNCAHWGAAQASKHGWRVPYWDADDWRQWGTLWALTILHKYGPDLTPGHAFSLVRTSAFRDIVDRSVSVHAEEYLPEQDLRTQPDQAFLVALPDAAQRLAQAVSSRTAADWKNAEAEWRVLFPHRPFYSDKDSELPNTAGLAFALGWPVAEVRRSQLAAHYHLT